MTFGAVHATVEWRTCNVLTVTCRAVFVRNKYRGNTKDNGENYYCGKFCTNTLY